MICHGPFLRGGFGGTNLRDSIWHTGDGSYPFIVQRIATGVSRPEHVSMPPRGGMPLSDSDVRAVAAFVYWYSRTHRDGTPAPAGSGH